MDTNNKKVVAELNDIAWALHDISHGRTGQDSQPLGLEAVTMALSGSGADWSNNVASGLFAIAGALNRIAECMENAASDLSRR